MGKNIKKTKLIFENTNQRTYLSLENQNLNKNKSKLENGANHLTMDFIPPKISLFRKYKYLNTQVTQVLQPHKPSLFLNKKKTNTIIIQNINSFIELNGCYFNTLDNTYSQGQWNILYSKSARCSCTKDRCKHLYCQCVQRNQPCSILCKCVNCLNLSKSQFTKKQSAERCKCQLFKCKTNYCECMKKGLNCGELCSCQSR